MFKTVFTIFRGSVVAAGKNWRTGRHFWSSTSRCGHRRRPLQADAGAVRPEITRLKRRVANAEARVTELDRGRLARLKAKRMLPA